MDATSVPCDGSCEDDYTALICALEDEAARRGYELLYAGARHVTCGTVRASSTAARRLMRKLLRDRATLFAVVVDIHEEVG